MMTTTVMTNSLTAEPPTLQGSNPLMSKLKKVLEKRIESDDELVDGLKTLSEFFTDNNIRTRRSLRSQIENRGVEIHENFLDEFSKVKEQLDDINNLVTGMHDSCREMSQRLNTAKSQTQDLIQQTTLLQTESQKLEMKARIAESFLTHFQLTPAESAILKESPDAPLTEEFFSAMSRIREVNERCKLLLRSQNQTAGLEIMESMSIYMEAAYERLYRWAQNECRMQTQELAEIPYILCLAMESIQDRPILFKYTLDEYTIARRGAVVKAFIDALSRRGAGGALQAIEVHSHDPLRYSGDMLAWLHQASASERESITTLLKKCSNTTIPEAMRECVDHITEGVCRTFKMRVEQVLVSEQDSIVLYKINNILQFYRGTLSHLVGNESGLAVTLEEVQMLSWRLFFNTLRKHTRCLLERPDNPTADLSPPENLHGTLTLLRDILTAQDVSMVTPDVRKSEFHQVLTALVDPLIQYCSMSASQLPVVPTAIFMTNCLYATQTSLARLEFTDAKLEQVQAHLEASLDTLVSEQAGHVLQRTSLATMYSRLQDGYRPEDQGPLASQPGLDASSVRVAMSQFDSYLASPDSLVMPHCNLLHSVKLRNTIRKRSADLVHSAYTRIHEAIADSKNQYSDPQSLAPRTPSQVAKLILNF